MTEQEGSTPGQDEELSPGERLSSGEPLNPPEPPDSASSDRALLRLETRVARAEAQVVGLQEAMADVHAYFRMAKQRSLYLRIGLLLAALAAFFYLRYSTSPG